MRSRWAWLLAAVIATAVAGPAQFEGSEQEAEDPSAEGFAPAIPRMISIVGQVLLNDGTAPPEPVLVEATCNNVVLPESYSDNKGRFRVEIGDRSQMVGGSVRVSGAGMNSSSFRYESSRRREATADLHGCELRVELTGFQTQVIDLDGREANSYLDIGVVRLRRHANVEGDSISITTLQAPVNARKRYDKALKQLRGRKANPEKAAGELRTALEEYPTFAAAWTLLGEIQWKSGDLDGAEGAFSKAVEVDPDYIRPYVPLARIAYQRNRWDDTLQLSDRILKINPYITDAVFLRALANFQLGKNDVAEESALQVRASNDARRFPEVFYLLGMIHSKRGDFLTAAADFRDYLKARPGTPAAEGVARQLVQWAELGVIPK